MGQWYSSTLRPVESSVFRKRNGTPHTGQFNAIGGLSAVAGRDRSMLELVGFFFGGRGRFFGERLHVVGELFHLASDLLMHAVKASQPFLDVLNLRGAFLAVSFGGTHRHRTRLVSLHRAEGQRTALCFTGSVQN